MPSLIDLRRRIRAVKNTQQITKAMKMVSAAKLRRAQERVVAARPFADKIAQTAAALGVRGSTTNATRRTSCSSRATAMTAHCAARSSSPYASGR